MRVDWISSPLPKHSRTGRKIGSYFAISDVLGERVDPALCIGRQLPALGTEVDARAGIVDSLKNFGWTLVGERPVPAENIPT